MTEQPGHTTVILQLLERLAAGDEQARDELITQSVERLQRLARKMLREYPTVHRWNETGDVLQNSLLRLHRALKTQMPESPRRFIGLAALQIRRELIDLYKHHYGPEGDGAHHASDPGQSDSHGSFRPLYEGIDPALDPADQVAIHEAVESLPDELREVFELKFYKGMQQEEIAALVGVSTKTIKRRWRDARLALQHLLADRSE
jgi:RNA polymerase sigma-70 factor (ECF subfamily)